eukprot:TRINITY_DN17373_c0_g1_i1.p1 TRINITY_DN17373_c0_g1~~TRINITY_DN17373_c0_g1_i1.p1  ORF type:complete len:1351 (+),score=275.75 TRINITY_DN17373_c0_g1_i1:50-4102(+)
MSWRCTAAAAVALCSMGSAGGQGLDAGECMTVPNSRSTCISAGQECWDLDVTDVGSWQCRCTGTQYGIGDKGQAICISLTPAAAFDECTACPEVTEQAAADTFYRGADLLNIPFITEDECKAECTRRTNCKAYSYTTANTEPGAGNCIAEEVCCWLKGSAFTSEAMVGASSGDKAAVAPCQACTAGTVCYDPTAGTEVTLDWQCRCDPDKGVQTLAMPVCVALNTTVLAYDECLLCPQIAQGNDVDVLYDGGDVANLPFLTLDECVEECTKRNDCTAFSYVPGNLTPPVAPPAITTSCIDLEACCRLKDQKLVTGMTAAPGVTSGKKLPATPCGMPPGFTTDVCDLQSQACYDPTAGTTTILDWLCICNPPSYGVQAINQVPMCEDLLVAQPLNECVDCSSWVTSASNTEFVGADVGTIPAITQLQCEEECALNPACAAMTYRPAGLSVPAGNCVKASDACCYLKDVGFTQRATTGVFAGTRSTCPGGRTGDAVCGTVSQTCYEPNDGRWESGDWVCMCALPLYGAKVGGAVNPCDQLAPPAAADECMACPRFCPAVDTHPDTELGGPHLAEIPGVTLDQCRDECTNKATCEAFTFRPTASPWVSGPCVDPTVSCCILKATSAASSSVMTGAAGNPGVTSSVKGVGTCTIPGGDACGAAAVVQECIDIDTSVHSRGDWYCRCAAPQYGVGLVGIAPNCKDMTSETEKDECAIPCPDVVAAADADTEYVGADLAAIPRITQTECMNECLYNTGCKAFTYIAPGSTTPGAAANCLVASESCCLLKSGNGYTTTAKPGATSGSKGPDVGCVSGGEICGNATSGPQKCIDPNSSRSSQGDWICQCKLAVAGRGHRKGGVAPCTPLSDPATWDECATCPQETAVTANDTDFYNGNFAAFPDADLDTCKAECLNNVQCQAFSFAPPGRAQPLASCLRQEDSCCYLKAASYTSMAQANYSSGVKAVVSGCPSASGDPGFRAVCAGAQQDCLDPTPNTGTLGDWLCQCRRPTFGAAVASVATAAECKNPSPPKGYDECQECPRTMEAPARASIRLTGQNLTTFAGMEVEDCATECNRRDDCDGYTHTVAGEATAGGACVQDASCCQLYAVGYTEVAAGPNVTSAAKVTQDPCPAAGAEPCGGPEPQLCSDPTAGEETTGDFICICKRDPEINVTGEINAPCPPPPTWIPETAVPPPTPPPTNASEGAAEENDDDGTSPLVLVLLGVLVALVLCALCWFLLLMRRRKAAAADPPQEAARAYDVALMNEHSQPLDRSAGYGPDADAQDGYYEDDSPRATYMFTDLVYTARPAGSPSYGRGIALPPVPPPRPNRFDSGGSARSAVGSVAGSRLGQQYRGIR